MFKHKKGLLLILVTSILLFVISCFIYVSDISFTQNNDYVVTNSEDGKISLFINNNLSSTVPNDDYYFLNSNKSFCSNNETINWDYSTKTLSINPLSKKTECVIYLDSIYKEEALNGNYPVLGSNMIPVIYNENDLPVYASISDNWYSYTNKMWANAVVLVDNPSKTYNVGDVIVDADVKGYFVWIPRYDYQIFNLGLYESTSDATAVIDSVNVRFNSTNTTDSNTTCHYLSDSCDVNKWVTHYAFAQNNSTGFWVSKYQSKINNSDIILNKSNEVYLSNYYDLFVKSYNYDRTNDSHMIKNAEWASILYLTNSNYGSNSNNSTTGNITGVFDLTSDNNEYVSSYTSEASDRNVIDELSAYNSKYFDVYSSSELYDYNKRILGDALGEMGPFNTYYLSSFALAHVEMPSKDLPFITRGRSNMFSSFASTSDAENTTSRVVLFTN